MNRIAIRLLGPGEEGVLANVDDDVFDEPVQPALAREFLAEPRYRIVVALDGDLVVGMATGLIHMHPDKGPEFFVNEVGVAGPWRRQGIGRRLMQAILDEARAVGCSAAWVGTETDNAEALALYRSVMEGADSEQPMVVFTFGLKAS